VRPPFYCEYGAVSNGDRTFVNVEAIMLDVVPITIGAACQIVPRGQLLTASHPIDPEAPAGLGVRRGDHRR
jgi:maltose O-acetyltransferase